MAAQLSVRRAWLYSFLSCAYNFYDDSCLQHHRRDPARNDGLYSGTRCAHVDFNIVPERAVEGAHRAHAAISLDGACRHPAGRAMTTRATRASARGRTTYLPTYYI